MPNSASKDTTVIITNLYSVEKVALTHFIRAACAMSLVAPRPRPSRSPSSSHLKLLAFEKRRRNNENQEMDHYIVDAGNAGPRNQERSHLSASISGTCDPTRNP